MSAENEPASCDNCGWLYKKEDADDMAPLCTLEGHEMVGRYDPGKYYDLGGHIVMEPHPTCEYMSDGKGVCSEWEEE